MAKKAAVVETKTAKKEESKDLVVSNLSSSSLAQFAQYDLGQFEGVKLDVAENKELFNNDILVPKVWLTQTMSDHRKEHNIKEGTFVDSQSMDILADVGGTLRFIVLKTFKRWHTFELVGAKKDKEFVSSEIMVFGKNDNLPYEEISEGKELVRRQVISAYVLLENEATKGINKPYIIDFASTSKGAGRIMISDIATLNANKLPSFVGFFELSAVEEKFEKGEAFVKKVKFGGYLGKEIIPFLVTCYKSLADIENQIVIDDSDIIKGAGETVEAEAKVVGKNKLASSKI